MASLCRFFRRGGALVCTLAWLGCSSGGTEGSGGSGGDATGGSTSSGPSQPGGWDADDVGQFEIPLDENCGDVPGLNGQAILAAKVEHQTLTMSLYEDMAFEGPIDLTIDLAWPDAPVALCFPGPSPKVAVVGVEMRFADAPGNFDETFDAAVFLESAGGQISLAPYALAAEIESSLHGAWKSPPDFAAIDFTMRFVTSLEANARGNIAIGQSPLTEIRTAAGLTLSAIAAWPYAAP